MRRKTMVLGGAILAGALAAGGSIFAAGNTVPSTQVLGYGTQTVSGATVNSIVYNLDPAGDNVDTVSLVLSGDTTTSNVSIAFNAGNAVSCGTGVYTTGTPGSTAYTCNNAGSNYVQPTNSLTATHVIVN